MTSAARGGMNSGHVPCGIVEEVIRRQTNGPRTLPQIRHEGTCLEPEVVRKRWLARDALRYSFRWTRQPAVNASWVDLEEFRHLYPSFKLTDELVVQEREVLCVEFNTNATDVRRKQGQLEVEVGTPGCIQIVSLSIR
jgi:hypothetical protein